MDDINYTVSSELYDEFDYSCTSKPNLDPNNVVSKFTFTLPPKPLKLDSDGDQEVTRKNTITEYSIKIEHSKSTVLNLVGLQIWRGALLLADWIIDNADKIPRDSYILELGAGVGLTSLVGCMFAPVYCTDLNRGDLFKLIESNYARNKSIMKYPITLLELDFMDKNISEKIQSILPKTSLIIAADVIYDDTLTCAFIQTVKKLMVNNKNSVMYIALEKRYVFTIIDCASVAPCYEFFIENLQNIPGLKTEELTCDFEQYFNYNRSKELVLWKVSSK